MKKKVLEIIIKELENILKKEPENILKKENILNEENIFWKEVLN